MLKAHVTRSWMRRGSALLAAAVAVALVVPGCSNADGSASGTPDAEWEASALHTEDGRIVDAVGRDVLLRGVNVNSLGEYWQGTSFDPVFPMNNGDWEALQARGFSVVRLLVSWSKIEPKPGAYDKAYLSKVDAYVKAAAAHHMYTVIDMHQDAYTAALNTQDAADCSAGTHPAKGWDGAPRWAVFTDDASTCTPGERNASPAVKAAWMNFYRNANGVADRFVSMWAFVAKRFLGRPEVAGFDLLNEPEVPESAAVVGPLYNSLMARTIKAIRKVESIAPFEHLLIVEPALPAGNAANGLVIPDPKGFDVDVRNVVAGAHNYAESIPQPALATSVEGMNALIAGVAKGLGVAVWIGEYGYWNTEPKTLEAARRQAADDDRRLWGGAWWSWKQSCGDPHSVQWDTTSGGWEPPEGETVSLHRVKCSDNSVIGETTQLLDIAGRGTVRAAPGRAVALRNDFTSGSMDVVGRLTDGSVKGAGRTVQAWTPNGSAKVTSTNVSSLKVIKVRGGRWIEGQVTAAGCYEIHVGTPVTTCANASAPSGASGSTGG